MLFISKKLSRMLAGHWFSRSPNSHAWMVLEDVIG